MASCTPQEPFAADATLADAGEFGLIAALTGRFGQGAHVYVGPGDDAAVLRTPKGHVVVSTDLLVEGRHFRREWAAARRHRSQGGRGEPLRRQRHGRHGALADRRPRRPGRPARAAGRSTSPTGSPRRPPWSAPSIVGGDLTTASEVVVAITVMGTCEVVAGAAQRGPGRATCVALAGRQGWAAAGLAVLGRGFRSPRVLVEAYQRPEPPYAAGLAAARAGATAMIDVSDGLVADAGHIAAGSGVAIDIERGAFELAEPMQAVGSALGVDPMQFVLGGGDDHAILATFPAGTDLPEGFTGIGSVAEGEGVTVDGAAYDGPAGWAHF